MIALDTNLLVHAHRVESPWHAQALAALDRLAPARWAIPWPCLHEFLAIVTHPRIFDPPTPQAEAVATVETWAATPHLLLLHEQEGYLEILADLLRSSRVTGPRVHDARVVAICLLHGVSELWTADRDFSRFPALTTRNPLLEK